MNVAVTIDDDPARHMPLSWFLAENEFPADQERAIRAALARGASYHGGGGAQPAFTVAPLVTA